MKLNKFIIGSLLAFGLVFSGCGGGGSSDGGITASDASGTAQLGYISGGNMKLFELSNLNTAIASTSSSTSQNSSDAGSFTFKDVSLSSNTYYLVEISGGQDIDPNDDGIIETDEAVDLNGSVYALAKGSDLEDGSVRITALSDMAYQKLKGSVQTINNTEIDTALQNSAKEYLFDVNGDGEVNNKDILTFDPTKHRDKTRRSYRDILDIYVPRLHSGADDSAKLSALMYLDNPRIVVTNGNLQEVPFVLNATLENEPKNLSVKWLLNGVEKQSLGENITDDGIYNLTVEFSKDGKVLKTVTTQVMATKKVEIASIDVDVTKENIVFVTDESNSSLAGTQIIVPKGALSQNTQITVKKSSVNSIPTTNGISITDVIVLEPSGLTFDEPVQIRIPYNDSVDLENRTVRIARYSADGTVDYIAPLFVDEDTKEIVFETEHFTYFEAKTGVKWIDTSDEKFINELNEELGYSYTINEWKPILNIFLNKRRGNESERLYDICLEYLKNLKIVQTIDNSSMEWRGYADAYALLYDNSEIMSGTFKRWDSFSQGLQAGEELLSLGRSTISGGVKSGLKTLAGLPSLDESLADQSADYNTYIFDTADKVLSLFRDIQLGLQVREIFNIKRDVNLGSDYKTIEFITRRLKLSEGITEPYSDGEGTTSIGLKRNLKNGWFDFGDNSEKISQELPPDFFWKRINALYNIYTNFKKTNYDEIVEKEMTSKESLKRMIELAQEQLIIDNEKQRYIDNPIASFSKEIEEPKIINTLVGSTISVAFTIETKGYYEGNFLPRIELKDRKSNALIQTLVLRNFMFTSLGTYQGKFTGFVNINIPKEVGNYEYKIYFEDDKLEHLFDNADSLDINLIVKEDKKQATVTGLSIQGELNSDGDFEVDLKGVFDVGELAHSVEVYLPNRTQYSKHFIIESGEFNTAALENVSVKVIPTQSVLESYYIAITNKTVNIKAKIDRALAGEVDNTLPSVKIIKVNGIAVAEENQNDTQSINVGENITYSIDRANLYYITKAGLSCNVIDDISDVSNYIYTCTYNAANVYNPFVKVVLKNDTKLQMINTPQVFVQEVGNIEPTIELPIDTKVYTAGEHIVLNAEVTDSDGYITSTKWTPYLNNLTIFNSTNAKEAYVVAPTILETEKSYWFKVVTTDNRGAQKINYRIVKVQGDSTKTRELTFVSETLSDNCTSYFNSECGYEITSGDTSLKIWKFQNTGNFDFETLQFVLNDDDSSLIVVGNPKLITASSDLSIDGEIQIATTMNYTDVIDGEYGARWLIQDKYGNRITMPNGNDAQMWFKVKLNRGISDSEINLESLIYGKTFYQNYCGYVNEFTFKTDGTISILNSDGSIESAGSYRIDGDIIYYTKDSQEIGLSIQELTDSYFKLNDASFYFTKSVAQQYPDNSDCGDEVGFDDHNKTTDSLSLNWSGRVVFKDANGIVQPIPLNTVVRITPNEEQINHNWGGVEAAVDSNGNWSIISVFNSENVDISHYTSSNKYQFIVSNSSADEMYRLYSCSDNYLYINRINADDPFVSTATISNFTTTIDISLTGQCLNISEP